MNLKICAGLSHPYFPPRPTPGVPLNKGNCDGYVKRESVRYHLQPKLNGDRALFCLFGGKTSLSSRHGHTYSFSCENLRVFNNLPDGTVLDGEVWQKRYYPFEAVVIGGSSLMLECPSVRARFAQYICERLSIQWLFDQPTQEWINNLNSNGKHWEGVVKKLRGSPYHPLASADQNSGTWFKNKW